MKKINIIRIVLIVLLIAMFYLIFGFSNQDGEESSGLSKRITEKIIVQFDLFHNLNKSQKEEAANKLEHIIRKIAHFSIYSVIGILLMSLMYTYKLKSLNRFYLSFFIGTIYSITDEFHQSFIPGRSAQVHDILIDSYGVIIGILVVVLIMKVYKYVKSSLNKTNFYS